MSSSPPSEALDPLLVLDPAPEDVAALARLRRYDGPALLEHPQCLAPAWPAPDDAAPRLTAAGRDPFEL
jgi:hypothetical protein